MECVIYLRANESLSRKSRTHWARCFSEMALIAAISAADALTIIASRKSTVDHGRHAQKWGPISASWHVRLAGISVSRLMPRCGENETYPVQILSVYPVTLWSHFVNTILLIWNFLCSSLKCIVIICIEFSM